MNNIGKQKIIKFMDELSSSSPTPGGGSVAALTGAFSYGLISMVAQLTLGKEKYKKAEKRLKQVLSESKGSAKKLLLLADKDAEVFDRVIAAYKTKNKKVAKKALENATDVPADVKKLSRRAEVLAKVVARLGNKNALSDAKSAIYLAKAAQKMADENIRINKSALARLRKL